MADKLSERLDRISRAPGIANNPAYTTAIREAAELARRVEGAAVVEMPSRPGPALQGAHLVIGSAAAERMGLDGQYVRLVPEPPEVG